jgi:hypothetical protein
MDPQDLLKDLKITGDHGAYTIRIPPRLVLLLVFFAAGVGGANWFIARETTTRLDTLTEVMEQTRDSIQKIERRQAEMAGDVNDVKEGQEKLGTKLKSLSGQVHKEHGTPPDWDDSRTVPSKTDQQGGG